MATFAERMATFEKEKQKKPVKEQIALKKSESFGKRFLKNLISAPGKMTRLAPYVAEESLAFVPRSIGSLTLRLGSELSKPITGKPLTVPSAEGAGVLLSKIPVVRKAIPFGETLEMPRSFVAPPAIQKQEALKISEGKPPTATEEFAAKVLTSPIFQPLIEATGAAAITAPTGGLFEGLGGVTRGLTRKPQVVELGDVFKKPGALEGFKLPSGLAKFPRPVKESMARAVVDSVAQKILPLEHALRGQGASGKEIMNLVNVAGRETEIKTGSMVSDLKKVGLYDLNTEEAFNLKNVLEGRTSPMNKKVASVFEIADKQRKDIATEAGASGATIKIDINHEVPFQPREDYFHHAIPPLEDLAKGELRRDVILNAVDIGAYRDIASASKGLDEYIQFIKTEKRPSSLIDYLLKSGQAMSEEDAFAKLQLVRRGIREPRYGAFRPREIDLPFYDPDPRRVLPAYVFGATRFIEQTKVFGKGSYRIKQLVSQIKDSGGDVEFTRDAVNRIIGAIQNSPKDMRVAQAITSFETATKLGLSVFSNATQPLYSLLAADFPSFIRGILKTFTTVGKERALRSGATIESILRESTEVIPKKGLGNFILKATGFQKVEKFNRENASNIGELYAKRQFEGLMRNPLSNKYQARIKELISDLNLKEAINRGRLSDKELLTAGSTFTTKTQFRARPQDLPMFAQTPWGKVFYQFKNFAVQSFKFTFNQTVGEFTRGEIGRGFRNILILATIFPMVGELKNDVVAFLRGKKRTTVLLDRYIEDIVGVGAFGVLNDALQSARFGNVPEFMLGPFLSDAGKLAEGVYQDYQRLKKGKYPKAIPKIVTGQIPVVGPLTQQKLFPPQRKQKNLKPPFDLFK